MEMEEVEGGGETGRCRYVMGLTREKTEECVSHFCQVNRHVRNV